MRFICIPCALLVLLSISWTSAQDAKPTQNPRYLRPEAGSLDRGGTRMLQMGDKLYFTVNDTGEHQGALYCTDGTPEGTRLVRALPNPTLLAVMGSTLFVASGPELWKSDGSPDGTVLVKDLSDRAAPARFPVVFHDKLYFAGYDEAHGYELWQSDGTAEGTVLVKDIAKGADSSNPSHLIVFNDKLYFRAPQYRGYSDELWESDGTDEGTKVMHTSSLNASRKEAIVSFKEGLYFASTDALFRIDLTGNVTTIKRFSQQKRTPYVTSLTAAGDRLFFTVGNDAGGTDLWCSDGSAAGTKLVTGTHPSERISTTLCAFGEYVVFGRFETGAGWETWKSNGTEAGSVRLARSEFRGELRFEDYGTDLPHGNSFADATDYFVFRAYDHAHGEELWITDGSEPGTVLLADIQAGGKSSSPRDFGKFRGSVYFFADNGVLGTELWRTDGTAEGTRLFMNINAGVTGSEPWGFAVAGNSLLFQADDGVHGFELWRTDGSDQGTVLVRDCLPGELDSGITVLASSATHYYFTTAPVDDRGTLWVSDGTTDGTTEIAELPMRKVYQKDWGPYEAAFAGERLFMLVKAPEEVLELWTSDATRQGTQRLASFSKNSVFYGSKLVPAGDKVFANLRGQLWVSDGTVEGTTLVHDFDGWSSVGQMVGFEGKLFFAATDRVHGRELWVSDGTPEGTRMVKDIYPPRK
ncbi:MAG: hypothetical protein H6839_01260 [Planctomycetes bacterium]|nr:hypothetical protein [Planctomycetota bacterium]